MSNKILIAIMIILILVMVFFGGYAVSRNYKECKLVPHTTFYCLTS